MGQYLKLFQTHSQYVSFLNTQDFIKPNVSYCLDRTDEVHYNPDIETRLIVTYNVTIPSIQLYAYDSNFSVTGAVMFDKIEIDGTEVSVADIDNEEGEYYFDTTGQHVVAYTLKDPTLVGMIYDEQTETITRYGAQFSRCEKITSIVIPDSVTTIGGFVSMMGSNLTSVTLGKGVTTIVDAAFSFINRSTLDAASTTAIQAINPNAIEVMGIL